MDKVRLEMDFLDALEKIGRISLDDPRVDLIPSEIEAAMQTIIANNIFETANGDLVGISGARVVTTNINEMEF
ncbi:DUF2922 domain-containing protein [Tissierella creatinini]|nr:DUF2922 domain-containing protein [Tissierella creatinini]TJX59226.1 DUF2922 domain-containing protein [Soehngenia saccharolytica]